MKTLLKNAAILLIAAILIQDIVWACPDMSLGKSASDTLAVPSLFQQANMGSLEKQLEGDLAYIAGSFSWDPKRLADFGYHLKPFGVGVEFEMDFDRARFFDLNGQECLRDPKDGHFIGDLASSSRMVVPCAITRFSEKRGGNHLYDAVITFSDEKQVILQKRRSGYPSTVPAQSPHKTKQVPGSPIACLEAIIAFCGRFQGLSFSAEELIAAGLRKKNDGISDLSLDTVKLELRQLRCLGIVEREKTKTTRQFRFKFARPFRMLGELAMKEFLSQMRIGGELNRYNLSRSEMTDIRREVRNTAMQLRLGDMRSYRDPGIHVSYSHDDCYYWLDDNIRLRRSMNSGMTLILFDLHNDLYADKQIDEGSWVYHALKKGYISKVVWVLPPWAREIEDTPFIRGQRTHYTGLADKQGWDLSFCFPEEIPELKGEVLVSVDYDYISADEAYDERNVHRADNDEILDAADNIVSSLQRKGIRPVAFDLARSGRIYTYEDQIPEIEGTLVKKITEAFRSASNDYYGPGVSAAQCEVKHMDASHREQAAAIDRAALKDDGFADEHELMDYLRPGGPYPALVAEYDDGGVKKVAGFIIYRFRSGLIEILRYGVAPGFAGQNVIDRLMNAVTEGEHSHRFQHIDILVHESDTALQTYLRDRKQFSCIKIEKGYFKSGSPAYRMRHVFNEPVPGLEEMKVSDTIGTLSRDSLKQIIRRVEQGEFMEAYAVVNRSIGKEPGPDAQKLLDVFDYIFKTAALNEGFCELLIKALRSPPMGKDSAGFRSSNLDIAGIRFAVVRDLPSCAARYFDAETDEAVIVFDERFFNMGAVIEEDVADLPSAEEEEAFLHLLTERLLHELTHDNEIGTWDEEAAEEARVIRELDIPLWRITQELVTGFDGSTIRTQDKINRIFRYAYMSETTHYSGDFYRNFGIWYMLNTDYQWARLKHYARQEALRHMNTHDETPSAKSFPGGGRKRPEAGDDQLLIHNSTSHEECYYWMEEMIKQNKFKKGMTLVLYDLHSDLGWPQGNIFKEGSWIHPAIEAGYISKVVWVLPPWARGPEYQEYIGADKDMVDALKLEKGWDISYCYPEDMPELGGDVLVSIDFDYLSSDDYDGSSEGEDFHRASSAEICASIEEIMTGLAEKGIHPVGFDLCRSDDKPYTFPDQTEFIEKTLRAGMQKHFSPSHEDRKKWIGLGVLAAAIIVVEPLLVTLLQLYVPAVPLGTLGIVKFSTTRALLSFIVFRFLGEILGQTIQLWRSKGVSVPDLKKDLDYKKVVWAMSFAAFFLSWFIPTLFGLLTAKLGPLYLGMADLVISTPITLPILFMGHTLIEKAWGSKNTVTVTDFVKRSTYRVRKTLCFALPYWTIVLFTIFSLNIPFDTQVFAISFFTPLYAVIQSLAANTKPGEEDNLRMRVWAKIMIPAAVLFNLGYLTWHLTIPNLFVGFVMYTAPVIFGFYRMDDDASKDEPDPVQVQPPKVKVPRPASAAAKVPVKVKKTPPAKAPVEPLEPKIEPDEAQEVSYSYKGEILSQTYVQNSTSRVIVKAVITVSRSINDSYELHLYVKGQEIGNAVCFLDEYGGIPSFYVDIRRLDGEQETYAKAGKTVSPMLSYTRIRMIQAAVRLSLRDPKARGAVHMLTNGRHSEMQRIYQSLGGIGFEPSPDGEDEVVWRLSQEKAAAFPGRVDQYLDASLGIQNRADDEEELSIEVRSRPPLDDIRDTRRLAKDLIGNAISMLLSREAKASERKLVLVFHENLAGLNDKKMAMVLTELEGLKKKEGFDRLLKNLTIIRSIKEFNEKTSSGGEIDPKDPNTVVFLFAPEDERADIQAAPEVKKVLISQKDEKGRLFDALSYFYPLPEIVTMTLVSYQNKMNAAGLSEALAKLGIRPDELNIGNIKQDDTAFLIFSLIGRIERYDQQSRDHYMRITNAIRAAA